MDFPGGKVDGVSTLSAADYNQTVGLNNAIASTGQTPSSSDLNQLAKSMAHYGSGNFYSDGGVANAYSLSVVGSAQTPASYFDGMEIRFRAANQSTGASTVTVGTLGSKVIKLNDGTTNISNQINTTEDVILRFDVPNDCFIFPNLNPSLLIPAGTIIAFAGTTPSGPYVPPGFLECNGAIISRTVYSTLFSAIRGVFGAGDGFTTFNIPDLRGEFIRGFDNGRGIDVGRSFGNVQGDEFRSHSHGGGMDSVQNLIGGGSGAFVHLNTQPLPDTGLAGGAETRPRNVALTYCIKY